MKKLNKIAIVVAVLCGIAAYVAMPYLAVQRLYQGFARMDADVIEAHVDFPSVRESLKEQANAYLATHMPQDESGRTGLLGAAGFVMMPKVVEAVVDAYVTPTGMRQMINRALMHSSDPASKEPRPLRREDIDYAFFENPDTFRVEARNMVFILRLKDWHWKLTEARMPPEVFARRKAPAPGMIQQPDGGTLQQQVPAVP